MDHKISIDPALFAMLQSLLNSGVIEQDGKKLDFSSVQAIRITNGTMTFQPPPKVSITVGPVAIKTTISAMTARAGGIHVEIDNSPVDLEIRPK